VQDLTLPALQRAIYDDVCSVSRTLSAALPRLRGRGLRAKLEVITRQSCPRFHADSVGVRCLCTYEGPGTWVVANRCVVVWLFVEGGMMWRCRSMALDGCLGDSSCMLR